MRQSTSSVRLSCRLYPISNPTYSQVLAKILCLLATNPECVKHLRKEVEMAIEQHGWTREGIAQMRVVDSFIKETVRFEGIGACMFSFTNIIYFSYLAFSGHFTKDS